MRSISPPQDPSDVEEAGATHFSSADDWCLVNAMRDVGLRGVPLDDDGRRSRSVGVWNGEELRIMSGKGAMCDVEDQSWWDLARQVWKYGLSPWRFRRAVLDNLERWRGFGDQGTTFDSVGEELADNGLDGPIISDSAEEYLRENLSIAQRFQDDFVHDFVHPCTRARFARNLADVRGGLSSLMAAAASGRGG